VPGFEAILGLLLQFLNRDRDCGKLDELEITADYMWDFMDSFLLLTMKT
jgi:hypothetical protein